MKILCYTATDSTPQVGSKVKISSSGRYYDGKWGIVKEIKSDSYMVDLIRRGGHSQASWVEVYPEEFEVVKPPMVSTATGRFIDIQNEVIKKYNITMDENSSCRMRTHCHPKERRICKFHQTNTARNTFELFHEIGHAETKESWMRRCESEYYATAWAIEKFHEYGLNIPMDTIKIYQDYINRELARGQRRHGSNYNVDMDLYKLL